MGATPEGRSERTSRGTKLTHRTMNLSFASLWRPLNFFSLWRSRRYDPSRSRDLQQAVLSTFSESKLLSLPAEVRLLIWEITFGGNFVALYRVRGRLLHTLLDNHNSQATTQDVAVGSDTIRAALLQLPGTTREDSKRVTSLTRLKAMGALLSCPLM